MVSKDAESIAEIALLASEENAQYLMRSKINHIPREIKSRNVVSSRVSCNLLIIFVQSMGALAS